MKIIFCIPGNNFSSEFLKSWTVLLSECFRRGIQVTMVNRYSPVIHFARALCLGGDCSRGEDQKPFGGMREYDYIMWIDSDIVFQPLDFFKLLDSPYPVTCGNYMMSDRTHTPNVKQWDDEYFLEHNSYKFMTKEDIEREPERYIQVAYSGMGWMLIKHGVIEQLKYPWFYHTELRIGDMVDMCSEDVSFCKNIQKLGIPIFIDKTIWVGHYKSFVI
jgi:hypothetical protein